MKVLPIILHIETSTQNCSVSISKGNELLCLCEEITEDLSHSEKLHVFVSWALEGAGVTLQEIDAVAVSLGAGSYTGLRIGLSAAKGFCVALDIPLIGLNTLEILAQNADFEEYENIVVALDARRMEIFTQVFDGNKNKLTDAKALIVEEDYFNEFLGKKVLFLGSGSKKLREFSEQLRLNEAFTFEEKALPSSEKMIDLALSKYQNNDFENVAYCEPLYLKPVYVTSGKN